MSTDTHSSSGWRLVVRGVEVRLRFAFALVLLAALMAGWPWLRAGWDRIASLWITHEHSAAVSGDTEFFCPMDPGVKSAWPAICPICNMDLIPRKKADAVLLPEGVVARMQLSPYRVQLAGIRTVPVGKRATDDNGVLTVPVDSVVHRGDEAIVYVESMPGMFDGVKVQLGSRDGEAFEVVEWLQAGQRVAAAGAFLIDAESRLNPSLSTQYFGANAQTAANRPPTLPQRRKNEKSSLAALSEAERALVEQQRICPVTEAALGTMGTPVSLTVQGRQVFLCCRGCEGRLLAEPDKYLAKLNGAPAR
jgi:hypothetical protein